MVQSGVWEAACSVCAYWLFPGFNCWGWMLKNERCYHHLQKPSDQTVIFWLNFHYRYRNVFTMSRLPLDSLFTLYGSNRCCWSAHVLCLQDLVSADGAFLVKRRRRRFLLILHCWKKEWPKHTLNRCDQRGTEQIRVTVLGFFFLHSFEVMTGLILPERGAHTEQSNRLMISARQ